MTNSWQKFKLLMWKNWTLQRRHKVQTFVEIIIPVLFSTLLVLVRSLVEPEQKDPVHFGEFSATLLNMNGTANIFPDSSNTLLDFSIPYSPTTENNVTRDLVLTAMVDVFSENLQYLNVSMSEAVITALLRDRLIGFPNSAALLSYLASPLYASDSSICGIALDDSLAGLSSLSNLPDSITMTLYFPAELRTVVSRSRYLNWYTDFAFSVFQVPGPRSPAAVRGGLPGYSDEGFSGIAHGLMRRLAMSKLGISRQDFPEIVMKRFPHPTYTNDPLILVLKTFLPLVMLLSFVYTCINTVKAIAVEKEHQLKEVMKVMGLDNWLHWIAWFFKAFSYILITIILIIILLKVEWYTTADGLSGYSVFTNTPWHFLLFFMMMYTVATICFCFMISVFFSKANTAATVAGIVWFLSYTPYTFLSNGRTLSPFSSRVLACFSFNTAMSFGFEIIMNHETSTEGLQWSKLWEVITADDPLVMGHILVMLVADSIIYLLIALYVEQVMPGSYGVPQPWNFPFKASFWFPSRTATVNAMDKESSSSSSDGTIKEHIEPDPKNLDVGVHISNLTKVYNGNAAVDELNLKIFEGQITVILGHNGAGKTTTMSMLTGIVTPTSGTAFVAGCDIRNNIQGVRASLGLCPQHNVLFPDLTVSEHIYFFSCLKGMSGTTLQQEVDKYVKLLGLEDKRIVLSHALSGGMKRRLSVGIALCGGSKVVLLDEPSSGIDPASRREMWDLLQADKKGRTIVMSTHFMDEAEVLGERVAVMAGGKVRAVGSPFFLKRKFSVGYTLTATTVSSASSTTPAVTSLIKQHIPSATLYSNIGSELSYHLPSEFSHKFEPLLQELELKHSEYGLNSYGISAGSLEDVFMKVGADAIETLDENDQLVFREIGINGFTETVNENEDLHVKEDGSNSESGSINNYRFSGARLWYGQWHAMFYKHMISTIRSWVLSLLRIFLPLLFLIVSIFVNRVYGLADILPVRNLTLSNGYEDSETIINYEGTLDTLTQQRMEMYSKYFEGSSTMNLINIGNQNMEDYYLAKAATNMPDMRKRNMAGATFSRDKIVVWFSNFAFHDLPASLMLVYNAIVKIASPTSTFSLINHPLPYTMDTRISMLDGGDGEGFQLAFNVGFSMAFVSSFYVLFYIKENVTRSKLLQLASGASPFILWTSAFLWDMLCFLIISISLIITLFIFQQSSFTTAVQLFRLLLLFITFGLAMLPLHYLASELFQSPSTGFSRMVFFNIFTGVATFLIVQVMSFPGLDLENVSELLHWIFLVVPHYAISDAIKRHHDGYLVLEYCYMVCDNFPSLNESCTLQTVCNLADLQPALAFLKACCVPEDPYFTWESPGIVPHLLYMICVAILTFCILLIKEYRFTDFLIHRLMKTDIEQRRQDEEEDGDVIEERKRVANMEEKDYTNHSLICKDMSKKYKKFLAVNSISFGVEQGECFGLLGMNGAGKTTTFKMLMGDLFMSSGDAWIVGHSVKNQMKIVYNHIGYCPQFDALLDDMTGRETMEMFASLKGIPPLQKEKYVWSLSRKLGFTKHLDKKVREYSGGNKRKLSTAVALLGDPEVVYLDEPTTGMDPVAKRQVWRAVANRNGGCVVLTSHSMEECEALCTRLAIMVNGSFRCLGSTQHLKNKFSQGYTLIVKLKSSETADKDRLEEFLSSHFPGAHLKEAYQNLVTYYLPHSGILWSRIFGLMEEAKNTLDLEDYSVGQTSLEQIFLQFTRDQVLSET